MKPMGLLIALVLGAGVCWGQLEGVVDVHAHADPETIPRSVDAMDLARIARKEGMRAVVLKNHFVPTAPIAFLVAREVPGIQVFGVVPGEGGRKTGRPCSARPAGQFFRFS